MDQKGKIFFFGPGSSLKFDFPIRTNKNAPSSDSNDVVGEEKSEDKNKHTRDEVTIKENKVASEATSDEDSNELELLKKIDAVLEGNENGVQEKDSLKKEIKENDSAKSKEISNDDENSKSALETFSQPELESCPAPSNDEIREKKEVEDDSNKELNKCESVNLSSECSNENSAKSLNVEKIEETEEVKNSSDQNKKPNEIELIKESSSNVNNLNFVQNNSDKNDIEASSSVEIEPDVNERIDVVIPPCIISETPPPSPPSTPSSDEPDQNIDSPEENSTLINDNLTKTVIINEENSTIDEEKEASTSKDESERIETEIEKKSVEENIDKKKEDTNLVDEEEKISKLVESLEENPSVNAFEIIEEKSEEIRENINEVQENLDQNEVVKDEEKLNENPSEITEETSKNEPQQQEIEEVSKIESEISQNDDNNITESSVNIPAKSEDNTDEIKSQESPVNEIPQIDDEQQQQSTSEENSEKIVEDDKSSSEIIEESIEEQKFDESHSLIDAHDTIESKNTCEISKVDETIQETVESSSEENVQKSKEEEEKLETIDAQENMEPLQESSKVESDKIISVEPKSTEILSTRIEEICKPSNTIKNIEIIEEKPTEINKTVSVESTELKNTEINKTKSTEIDDKLLEDDHKTENELSKKSVSIEEKLLAEHESEDMSLIESKETEMSKKLDENEIEKFNEKNEEILESENRISEEEQQVIENQSKEESVISEEKLKPQLENEIFEQSNLQESISTENDESVVDNKMLKKETDNDELQEEATSLPTEKEKSPPPSDSIKIDNQQCESKIEESTVSIPDINQNESSNNDDNQNKVHVSNDSEMSSNEQILETEQQAVEEIKSVEINKNIETEQPITPFKEEQKKDIFTEKTSEEEIEIKEHSPIENVSMSIEQEEHKIEENDISLIEKVEERTEISNETGVPQEEQPKIDESKQASFISHQQEQLPVEDTKESSEIDSDDNHYEDDNVCGISMSPEQIENEPEDKISSPLNIETKNDQPKKILESSVESENVDSVNVLSERKIEDPFEKDTKLENVNEKECIPAESINDNATLKIEKNLVEEEKEETSVELPKPPVEIVEEKPISETVHANIQVSTTEETNSTEKKIIVTEIEKITEQEQSSIEIKNELPKVEEAKVDVKQEFQKPQAATRKRKLSERKSISESDSDGGSNLITDSAISNDNHSEEEEEVIVTKKPRIRGKVIATRNTRATRQSMKAAEETKTIITENTEQKDENNAEEKTIQNFKFDYDENEDIAANVAAIKTLICKDQPKDESDKSSDEESKKKKTPKRKSKRGRGVKKNDAHASSSDEEGESKAVKTPDSKRTKTSESEEPSEKQPKKKRESVGKGLLKYIDTSLVIETVETEAPIRQSRRIAQQKIKEENDRRLMEEKLLKQMKEDAERKKKGAGSAVPELEDENDRSSDESYKGSKRKKKKKEKLKASDKPWQTSSSHSEHSETEEEFEHPHSPDPGSPLFKSDHEFSPESDVDDAPSQPVKRARTAKKQEESSDEEDVNPNHACQVCHKTDSPEWILLCDECDHGYHCSCLKPIIFCIPSGNWYCPLCCHKKLIANLSTQLEKLDALVDEIQAEEIRKQKQLEMQKLTEITEQNIIKEKRKNRPEINRKREPSRDESSEQENESNDEDEDGSSSDNSSDNAPLIYKLRKRNQTTASYRFNEYDDLINSAIRDEMEEVKGMGNAGRGKDISTIIEADKEEKKLQKLEKHKEKGADEKDENEEQEQDDENDGESSDSEIVRPKKSVQRKKKNRKLNNLDDTSEEDKPSDEDFKDSSSSDSEEDYSMSSVSESSLDLPLKKGSKVTKRSTRSAAKNRRYEENFINDNSSDDEPLIKKRTKKQIDSDEESFDANDEDDEEGSTADEINSDDLCDDTETDSSSEGNWPKKKKKRVASYDTKKPRKPAKKDDDDDKAFRAGISKKKILKKSDNESEASDEEQEGKGRRKTRGKKLLYLIEDDYESDDGIKPGVIRPETPPEEREMFVKKQEEIKRMLAAKNTEAARQLAVPTIEPIKLDMQQPKSPSPPPASESTSSLSMIPKNVIEGAKALDMDYNRLKPLQFGIHPKSSAEGANMTGQDMSEEELARMMEEEDFAQHQLKLAGEAIARSNKLLELEGKEEAFAQFSKNPKLKEEKTPATVTPQDPKKRTRKPKTEKLQNDIPPPLASSISPSAAQPRPIENPSMNIPPHPHIQSPIKQSVMPSIPPLIPNTSSHPPFVNLPPRYVNPNQPPPPSSLIQDRPSVLSNFMPRHELVSPQHQVPPQHMRHQQQPLLAPPLTETLAHKTPPMPHLQSQQPIAQALQSIQTEEVEEKKKGRRKKYTPLRTDLPESKVAKLDTPVSSVIHSTLNLTASADDKTKGITPQQRVKAITAIANAPTQFGSPMTNPTPSVITRLLQPQQRGPFGGSFVEQMTGPPSASAANSENPVQQTPPLTNRAFPDDPKHIPVTKQLRPSNPATLGQPPFNEHTFVPRSMHPLYRGPPTSQPSIYGLPHARIPYPFHHLHPNSNLRPNMQEYTAPYNIPAQFGYYAAPPAHGRHHLPQNPVAVPLSTHPITQAHADADSRNPNDDAHSESSSTSEFGGLVSYFSSQQELD
ncbi:hypothetical protein PVAND_004939 [Polypedilum vanderplanki]|uniref:PHD-type domain-containing protein n=1 Tax=Polypedilum vanderplanki TaxID=319348 RepID=A0A9J6C0J0_POLVA|nr:hypothetical protein PVAND_004939 [Polypedilum vanderplanki]